MKTNQCGIALLKYAVHRVSFDHQKV